MYRFVTVPFCNVVPIWNTPFCNVPFCMYRCVTYRQEMYRCLTYRNIIHIYSIYPVMYQHYSDCWWYGDGLYFGILTGIRTCNYRWAYALLVWTGWTSVGVELLIICKQSVAVVGFTFYISFFHTCCKKVYFNWEIYLKIIWQICNQSIGNPLNHFGGFQLLLVPFWEIPQRIYMYQLLGITNCQYPLMLCRRV
jgi:hypothetical protein